MNYLKTVLLLLVFVSAYNKSSSQQSTFVATWENNYFYQNFYRGTELKDNNLILTGTTTPYDTTIDRTYVLVSSLSSKGDTLYFKKYGDIDYCRGYDILEINDTTFIIGGKCYNKTDSLWYPYLLKINENGDTLWTKELTDLKDIEISMGYIISADSNILFGGIKSYSLQPDSGKKLIIGKLGQEGNILWTQTYDTSLFHYYSDDFRLSNDKGVLFTTDDPNGLELIKLDSSGNIEWNKAYNYTINYGNNKYGGIYTMIASNQISGSNSIYLGVTTDVADIIILESYIRIGLMKTNYKGEPEWNKYYGGDDFTRKEDEFRYITTTNDNHIILGGNYNTQVGTDPPDSDYYLFKLDTNGNVVWERRYGDSEKQFLFNILSLSGGGYLLIGYKISRDGSYEHDPYIIKIDENGNLNSINDIPFFENQINVYPNPSPGEFTFYFPTNEGTFAQLEILDIIGKKVYSTSNIGKYGMEKVDMSHLEDGIYIYQLFNKKGELFRGKLIKTE